LWFNELLFLTTKSSTYGRTIGTSKQITIKKERSDFVDAGKNGLSPNPSPKEGGAYKPVG
jgi:hypothetical protein